MLTPDDLNKIGLLIKTTVQDEVKLSFKDLVGNLPTKDEFYTMMDKLMKELKEIREEQSVLTHQTYRNTKDIEIIKTHIGL